MSKSTKEESCGPLDSVGAPVLLLVFNRPDLTIQVLEEVIRFNPTKLYISGDGPRSDCTTDIDKCKEVRALFEGQVFPFPVEIRFNKENLGCKKAVAGGLDWFFSQEEEGIILEDDCLPSPAFFKLTIELLGRYRHERRIWGIGGSNSYGITLSHPGHSFSFTSYPLIWGWATWADRWSKYDRDLVTWSRAERRKGKFRWANWQEKTVFTKLLNRQARGEGPDTWDYQWTWTVLSNRGLWVIPKENLVSNIGFRQDATHTTWTEESGKQALGFLGEIQAPERISLDKKVDLAILSTVFGLERNPIRWMLRVSLRIMKKLARPSIFPRRIKSKNGLVG